MEKNTEGTGSNELNEQSKAIKEKNILLELVLEKRAINVYLKYLARHVNDLSTIEARKREGCNILVMNLAKRFKKFRRTNKLQVCRLKSSSNWDKWSHFCSKRKFD